METNHSEVTAKYVTNSGNSFFYSDPSAEDILFMGKCSKLLTLFSESSFSTMHSK